MIAVIAGLGTALAWGLATVVAARATRVIGAWSTTAWVVLIGLLVTLPMVVLEGPASDVDVGDLSWLALGGLGYVTGMVLNYSALSGGKIPVTAPIVSTEGAIAATAAVLTGEPASPLLLAMLLLVAIGIFVTALQPGGGLDALSADAGRYVALAVAAAVVFGIGLYASGRASSEVPSSWVVAAGRVFGVIGITLPLVLGRRLRLDRRVLPALLFAGIAEVVGVYLFALGAQDSIAVSAVLSSQFAVVAAVIAHALGERISPRQWLGVAGVTLGVTAITLSRL